MACRQPGFNSRRVHSIGLCPAGAGRGFGQRSGRLGFVPCPRARRRKPICSRPSLPEHPCSVARDGHTDGSRIRLGRVALLKRSPREGREGSNPSPSAIALVVKRTSCRASNAVFQVQILAEALLILWPSGSGRLLDTEEVGGSIPPRITVRDAACGVAVARGPVKAEVMGFDSPRAALEAVGSGQRAVGREGSRTRLRPDLPAARCPLPTLPPPVVARPRKAPSSYLGRCGCETRRRL